jgi:hypothetical protein
MQASAQLAVDMGSSIEHRLLTRYRNGPQGIENQQLITNSQGQPV